MISPSNFSDKIELLFIALSFLELDGEMLDAAPIKIKNITTKDKMTPKHEPKIILKNDFIIKNEYYNNKSNLFFNIALCIKY